MHVNHSTNPVEGRRRLLRTLGAGTAAGAVTMIPGRWARPVIDSVVLPAHAQTSAPPRTAPAVISYALSVDSIGADSLSGAFCDNALPSGQNPLRVTFSVSGWTASLTPAPPTGTDLHVRGVILSYGQDNSSLAPGTTCVVDQPSCVTPFDSNGVAAESGFGLWQVTSDPGFDGPGAPTTVEYGLEFSVPSLPEVPVQTVSLGSAPVDANCFD